MIFPQGGLVNKFFREFYKIGPETMLAEAAINVVVAS
mgnify:FL=1